MATKRVITQDTFDGVVRENVAEFGMAPLEATEDAIQQFEAQGVDLSNVVTTTKLTQDGDDASSETVSESVSNLVNTLKGDLESSPLNEGAILDHMARIRTECNTSLAHRCLFGNRGLANILMDACQRFEDVPRLANGVLSTVVSLTNGQPDVITDVHVKFLCELLQRQTEAEDGDNEETLPMIVSTLKLLRHACIKHEGNRLACMANGLAPLLLKALARLRTDPDVVRSGCALLRVLTLDDDIRVPFGKGHEHAKIIVTDCGGIGVLLGLTRDVRHDAAAVGELLLTLGSLSVRNEFCQEIVDEGGLHYVIDSLLENVGDQNTVRSGLSLLRALAGNDKVKGEIVKANGVPLILSAIDRHQAEAQVCEMGCTCLAALALRSPANCQAIVEAGGINTLLTVMKIHKESALVLKSACRAIRNLISRTREYSQNFLDNGAEELINEACKRHRSQVEDEAKAALRDLGCSVQLKELWTGKKGSIVN